METLARLFVAMCELLEAEGRICKRQIARILTAVGAGAVVVVLILVGLGFLLGGFFGLLAKRLTPGGAGVVMGVAILFIASVGILWIRRLLR